MGTVTIPTFGGEVPRVTPRLLSENQASVAVNCQLQRGALEALRAPELVKQIGSPAKTIFKHDVDGWLSWDRVATAIKSAVLDVSGEKPLGHVFMTGVYDYPVQYLSGGVVTRLGIPRPTAAPSVTVVDDLALGTTEVYGWGAETSAEVPARYGIENLPTIQEDTATVSGYADDAIDGLESDSDSGISRSTSYCYTYVRYLADGIIQQESAPSPPSEVYDIPDGGGCVVSGFTIPDIENLCITHIRLYRTVSGTETSNFRFVVEIPVDKLSSKYEDTALDVDISTEILQTSMWDEIPDEAKGIMRTDNGIYACFRGNELLVSEPFVAYAYPEEYRLTVEDKIVALAHSDNTIIMLTEGRPYLATGSDPESLTLTHLPIEQACVSARSVAMIPGGAVYASPDGLMLFSSSEQTILTGETYTREQWRSLSPETLIGTVLDGRYVGFFENTNRGILISLGAKDVVQIELPADWKVRCLYHHSEDDCVYMSVGTDSGNGIYKFESGEPLTYRWRSKPYFTSTLINISAVRVEGDFDGKQSVRLSIYGPGQDRARENLKVSDSRTKRVNVTRSEKSWNIEVAGTVTVYELRMGTSVSGVEHGE